VTKNVQTLEDVPLCVRNGNPQAGRGAPRPYPIHRSLLPRGQAGVELSEESVVKTAVIISQSNCRPFLAYAGCLLEGMSDLQDAEIVSVAAYDLDADRQSFRSKACRN
jgi:hypothetical protein